jgi:hypothetical protein
MTHKIQCREQPMDATQEGLLLFAEKRLDHSIAGARKFVCWVPGLQKSLEVIKMAGHSIQELRTHVLSEFTSASRAGIFGPAYQEDDFEIGEVVVLSQEGRDE